MIFCFNVQLPAQYDLTKSTKLGISIGPAFFGPTFEMRDHMIANGFDETTWNYFANDYLDHPSKGQVGFSFDFYGSYAFQRKHQVGMMIHFAELNQTIGATKTDGIDKLLIVYFQSWSIIPFYTYQPHRTIEIQAGPSLMINTAYTTSKRQQDKKVSLGLLVGPDLVLWSTRNTFAKVGIKYLWAIPVEIGPYTAGYGNSSRDLPATKIGFGHLITSFAFGIHI